jgi:uncharacterized protein
VELAARQGQPILILQGGRDYQVTVDDDLARWKSGLANRPELTIRVLPADNHFFFPRQRLVKPGRERATAAHGPRW